MRANTYGIHLLMQLAESMGVVWIDSHAEAHTATHVIVSDGGTSPVRRTVKLMIALCRTSKLVRLDWLVQSAAQKMVLPCDSFLVVLPTLNLTSKPTGSSNRSVHRNKSNTSPRDEVGKDAYLLTGWSVLLCNGVASTKKTPPLEDYQWIVQAAGAQWMTAASFLEPTAQPAQQKLLVVTSDPERKSQCAKLPAPVLAALNAEEAKKRTTTWLFVALMSQNVDDLSPI